MNTTKLNKYWIMSLIITVTVVGCSPSPLTVTPTATQVYVHPSASPTFEPTATVTAAPTRTPLPTPSVDFKQFELDFPQQPLYSNPSWSPDRKRAVVSIRGLVNDKYQTGVALFDLDKNSVIWLHRYLSLKGWDFADAVWSPDGKWIALVPKDVAFYDDGELWIFSADGTERRQFRAQYLRYWSSDSRRVVFGVKDYCGFVDILTWTSQECE